MCVVLLSLLAYAKVSRGVLWISTELCKISDMLRVLAVNTGADLWSLVLAEWRQYQAWLGSVLGVAGPLADCISAERAAEFMARGLEATPTLAQTGAAAFRSQVIHAALHGGLQTI